MEWKNYSHLSGSHAFLSPSRHHWLNYTNEKLILTYRNHRKAALGTKYHALASDLINLAVRLPSTPASLNSFVNDAIGFKMSSEVLLYYSPNSYGTVDAISFYDGVLRIHDLKTGVTPGSMNQLMIYAALFCLDYSLRPDEITTIVLRIYQEGEIIEYEPTVEEVFDVTRKLIEADKILKSIEAGV
jgi:hypothetical protein